MPDWILNGVLITTFVLFALQNDRYSSTVNSISASEHIIKSIMSVVKHIKTQCVS